MLSANERQSLIEAMRRLPDDLEASVAGLTTADLDTPFMPGEWTVAQNVHHIADSHMNAFIRTKLALTEASPTIKPYDQEAWAETVDASGDIGASLALIRGLHERWCSLWDRLSDEQWQRPYVHPDSGPQVIEDLLTVYARHGAGHIDQIERTLAARPT